MNSPMLRDQKFFIVQSNANRYPESPKTPIEIILEDINPPVKLSAVDNVLFDLVKNFPISDSIEFTDSKPIMIFPKILQSSEI